MDTTCCNTDFGNYDDWNWKGCGQYWDWSDCSEYGEKLAREMCCVCGGGQKGKCTDTDNGATDADNYGCLDGYSVLLGLEEYCGTADDDDFNPKEMCCSCGGGNMKS